MRKAAVSLALAICLCVPPETSVSAERIDPVFITALREAVNEPGMFEDVLEGLVWLAEMSGRLQHLIGDPFSRLRLLRLVHTESTSFGLDPQLVLALIEVESGFDRHAVSRAGARGLMQVMPFWLSIIVVTEKAEELPPRLRCSMMQP